jgi:hypothetical protein
MYAKIDAKIRALLANETELNKMPQSNRFSQYDAQIPLCLAELNEEVEASLHSAERQLAALDCKLFDAWASYQRLDRSAVVSHGPA